MDLGIFDHLDRRDESVAGLSESRLPLLEKYDLHHLETEEIFRESSIAPLASSEAGA